MALRKNLVAILIACLALALLIVFREWGVVRRAQSGIVRGVATLAGMVKSVGRAGLGGGSTSAGAILAEQVRALEAEQELLRFENERLRSALKFSESRERSLRGARVLLFTKELDQEFLVIDQGQAAGIREGDPVVDAGGILVGTVREGGEEFAKVALASNPGAVHEVLLIPLGVRALARALGARTFSLELILATVPVRTGDFVALASRRNTSGAVHPPLLMGEVVREETRTGSVFKEVRATLLARPELLEEVFVITTQSE